MTGDELVLIILASSLIGGALMNIIIDGIFKTLLRDAYEFLKNWFNSSNELSTAIRQFQDKRMKEVAQYVSMGLDVKAAEEIWYLKYENEIKQLGEVDPHLKSFLEKQKEKMDRRSAVEHTTNLYDARLYEMLNQYRPGFQVHHK